MQDYARDDIRLRDVREGKVWLIRNKDKLLITIEDDKGTEFMEVYVIKRDGEIRAIS